MTEFGAIGNTKADLMSVDRLLDSMDLRFQSWAYWQYKDFHDDTTMNKDGPLYDESGRLVLSKLKVLSRTYAPAVAGTPRHMSFDSDTAEFHLAFARDRSISLDVPTEIYLNEELHYPTGFTVDTAPLSN